MYITINIILLYLVIVYLIGYYYDLVNFTFKTQSSSVTRHYSYALSSNVFEMLHFQHGDF